MTLEELFDIVEERANASPDESWTARLLSKGPEKCAEKFGEEAVEAIIEAAKGNKTGLIKESADVIFHLFVLLRSQDITLSEVLDELTSRQFQSGLAEKAARSVKK
ncbi:MAG: phosphoribosyl-ATP diphosphatase [Paracoccaceae bacterium]